MPNPTNNQLPTPQTPVSEVLRRPGSLLLLLSILLAPSTSGADAPKLQRYETKYYILLTDVPPEQVQEVVVRMTKMAEEYHNRTRDFSGIIRDKFPFYLFRNRADYLAGGGLEGTDGVFDGHALYAVAGQKLTDRTWHVVQHEGFHQFAAAVVGGDLPVWINEGLAEYFGEALFTGDGFISGVIPDWRLKRVRDEIHNGTFISVDRMMGLSHDQWNANFKIANYDQAWSMVHFLANGDGGKYRQAFSSLMRDLARGKSFNLAWNDNFGSAAGFEDKWKAYWLNLPDDPSHDQRVEATVARLTSFLARAIAMKQTFVSFDDFHTAAQDRKLKISKTDWLPPVLLKTALADADDLQGDGAQWTLITGNATPQVRCKLKNGLTCIGAFQLQNGQVARVDTKLETKPGPSGPGYGVKIEPRP
jgi:hypothetical protein